MGRWDIGIKLIFRVWTLFNREKTWDEQPPQAASESQVFERLNNVQTRKINLIAIMPCFMTFPTIYSIEILAKMTQIPLNKPHPSSPSSLLLSLFQTTFTTPCRAGCINIDGIYFRRLYTHDDNTQSAAFHAIAGHFDGLYTCMYVYVGTSNTR